jgi:probable rRNA maturation factor
MIDFNSESDFEFEEDAKTANWISSVIALEGYEEGEISFIFCDDAYLLKLNQRFLDHDTLTDILSFDYSVGKEISGEIYISVERVKENAMEYSDSFIDELHRVIIHGILHYCGYQDKEEEDIIKMRQKENDSLRMLKEA